MNFARTISSRLTVGVVMLFATETACGQHGTVHGTITTEGARTPQDVLVYLSEVPGDFSPPKTPVEMDTKQLEFNPWVLPVLKGTTVLFNNRDRVKHNVAWSKSKDSSYPAKSLGTWGQGAVREFTYDREGIVAIGCKIHPEMAAYIVVLQNPFFAVVGEDGVYEFNNVPAGNYSLQTWYPNRRILRPQTKEVTITAGEVTIQDFSMSRRNSETHSSESSSAEVTRGSFKTPISSPEVPAEVGFETGSRAPKP